MGGQQVIVRGRPASRVGIFGDSERGRLRLVIEVGGSRHGGQFRCQITEECDFLPISPDLTTNLIGTSFIQQR